MLLMEGLLVAVGFTGALTLVWGVRKALSMVSAGSGTSAHFGPAAAEALAREIGKASREVLVLGAPGAEVIRPPQVPGRQKAPDLPRRAGEIEGPEVNLVGRR